MRSHIAGVFATMASAADLTCIHLLPHIEQSVAPAEAQCSNVLVSLMPQHRLPQKGADNKSTPDTSIAQISALPQPAKAWSFYRNL